MREYLSIDWDNNDPEKVKFMKLFRKKFHATPVQAVKEMEGYIATLATERDYWRDLYTAQKETAHINCKGKKVKK